MLETSNLISTNEQGSATSGMFIDSPVVNIQCDSFGTRPKKMRISQRLFIRFKHAYMTTYLAS